MQGNPAMKAKRVTGPSAQTQLNLAMALMRCSVAGCTNEVILTRNLTDATTKRQCIDHIDGSKATPKPHTWGFAPDPMGRRSVFGN